MWIPVPSNSEWQQVEGVTVEGVADYKITTDPLYHNRMVYVNLDAPQTPVDVTVRYTVARKEMRVLSEAPRHPKRESDAFLKMNLRAEPATVLGSCERYTP